MQFAGREGELPQVRSESTRQNVYTGTYNRLDMDIKSHYQAVFGHEVRCLIIERSQIKLIVERSWN